MLNNIATSIVITLIKGPTTLGLLFFLCISAQAGQQAVLVGINDYPLIESLEGPRNDVSLLRDVLIEDWGFSSSQIVTLLDDQASRANILNAVAAPLSDGSPGDLVFFYFSGHGTSAVDGSLAIDVPKKTGALIPYDIAGVDNKDELLERIIVGRRDLQPILKQLDEKGFEVIVIVDACYSGNVIRDKKQRDMLPKRFIRLTDLLPKSKTNNRLGKRAKFEQDVPYPYEHVISLSAAHEYESAQDIPAAMLAQYPTIDGKPHGAFTDSLLRAMSNIQAGDTDQNGVLSYRELFISIKNIMRARKFSSTPQLQPELQPHAQTQSSRAQIIDLTVFGNEARAVAPKH